MQTRLAKIKDIIKDAPALEEAGAILRTGGLMGFGGKDVVVPLDTLSVAPDGKLVLNMTDDQLKLLPKVN